MSYTQEIPSSAKASVEALDLKLFGILNTIEHEFKSGRHREGEVPAEPHGARTCQGDGSPGGSPSQFFHSSLVTEGEETALVATTNLLLIRRGFVHPRGKAHDERRWSRRKALAV